MFGTYFYNQHIRKSVALFGTLFNNIYILRKDAAGGGLSTVKVPLAYAQRRKYIQRLLENSDLINDTKVAIKLPRMSFEIINFNYDGSRQLVKTNNRTLTSTNDTKTKFYTPVPYLINFQLSIYAKTQDDALQVVEQIIPFFNPQYSLSIKPLADYPQIIEDIPITLTSISFTDDNEGALEDRRTIIYTLDFEMKMSFYGPTSDKKIVRTVTNEIYLMDIGLLDSDVKYEILTVTPDPYNVSPDSDYGFNININVIADSA